ncbi:SOSS complex subunit B1 [Carpediemonas membranifera]|uniref:SOSS complex subunit B1 n=1 Tax=Carpediemonas membranifera TaxID=201153 RepID=A0A8J6B2X9_9EUKA|nr:SOSS complex subunit B1 [Carpediemonas membranifera]|eukprot:KAG9393139.1 SOSS complex subunit B1 [Carpediemonas membranifera]
MADIEFTNIEQLVPAMKDVSVRFIVVNKKDPEVIDANRTKCDALIADATGQVTANLWGDELSLEIGDIAEIQHGYTTLFHDRLVIQTGRHGKIIRTGEIDMVFSMENNMSLKMFTRSEVDGQVHWRSEREVMPRDRSRGDGRHG